MSLINSVSTVPTRFTRTVGKGPVELVGRSPAIARAQELVRRAAAVSGGTLITAELGTDVESIARELHERSVHSSSPYVIFSCDASDPAGVDRLLFGQPISPAPADLESVTSDSRLAAARGGTLFLQNVHELPAAAQARLARIARDGEVRIDGTAVATAFRLVASTPPGIDADVQGNRFRSDLFRRLSAVRIDLPPLRDRAEDVPALAVRLLDDLCVHESRPAPAFSEAALVLVGALTWPGNLAELRDAIAQGLANTRDDMIQIEQLLPALQLHRAPAPFLPAGSLREARLRFERDYISAVLHHHRWRMSDAAHTLGIQRPNLYRKARQLGIPLARLSE
jgi:DNA-binding NtrC family response regulator